MADATGSIAFLGAARFQGYWNAATNEATGSALDGAKFTSTDIGLIPGLFETGSSAGGGYGTGGPNVTASAGDYWQVTGSGTHNADGATSWNLNDWCIYSGSASGTGAWRKLAFEDTIASIVIGDLSSSSFHMGAPNDTHVIFGKGSVHSGSSDFVYNYEKTASATDALKITGGTVQHNDAFTVLVPTAVGGLGVTATVMARTSMGSTPSANQIHWHLTGNDATKIANLKLAINGTSDTSKVKYGSGITNGTTVGIKGLTATVGVTTTDSFASLTADNAGAAGSDITITDTVGTVLVNESALTSNKLTGGRTSAITNVGNLILTGSFHIADDKKIIFGANNDASIEYDEDGTDELRFAGANATFEQGVSFSFVGNPSSLNYNVTIPASTNAVMYGPTISDTAVLKIIDISVL